MATVDTIREPGSPHGDIVHAVSERGVFQDGFKRRNWTECGIHIENPGLARTSPERTAELRLIGPILDIRLGTVESVTCTYCYTALRSPS